MYSIVLILSLSIFSLFINNINAVEEIVMAATSTVYIVQDCDTRINNCDGPQDYSGVTIAGVIILFIFVFACVYCLIIEPRDFEYELKRNNNNNNNNKEKQEIM